MHRLILFFLFFLFVVPAHADVAGSARGDSCSVNGVAATDFNLLDNLYIDWALNTGSSPDDVTAIFNYAETLAGNPALGAEECVFTKDGTGGGLLCEGASADSAEGIIVFNPTTSDKTVTIQDATTTLVGRDTTDTLTNKTLAVADNEIHADDALTLAANPADCSANQFANTIAANGNLTCSALADADIPNTITIDAAAALASNPTDCSAGQYATTIAANGNLTCAQVSGTQVSNTPAGNIAATTAQAAIDELDTEKLGTSGNAATASALASNPTDCSSNQFANAIAANGNLTCAALVDADIPDTITASNYALKAGDTFTGNVLIDNEKEVRLLEADANGSNYIGFKAPTSLSADLSLTWNITASTCTGDGNGGALTVNGSNQIVCSADDGGGGSALTVEESDANPTVSSVSKIQFNASHFTVTDETGGQVQIDSILSPLATALANNPSDCSAGQYATTIAANGNLTCAAVSASQVTNSASGNIAATDVQTAINELDSEKVAKSGVQSLTIADSGNGSHATDSSTAITGNTLAVTCSDADGCDLTLSETSIGDGQALLVYNAGTSNTLYLVQSSGVAQMCAGATISLAAKTSNVTKSALFRYVSDRWQQDCRQTEWADLNNVPAFRKTLVQLRPTAYEPPSSNFATLDTRNSHPILNFDTTTSECALWTFVLPNWYGGNGVTMETWTVAPTATSGTVQWDWDWERVEATQDIDSDGFTASVNSSSATSVSGTSGVAIKQTVTFTNGPDMDSCAAGELCRVKLCRNVAGDNLAEDASLVYADIIETP